MKSVTGKSPNGFQINTISRAQPGKIPVEIVNKVLVHYQVEAEDYTNHVTPLP